QGDTVGQTPIGVQRDHDALLEIALEGMVRHLRDGVRVHVARKAHFERNATLNNLVKQTRIFSEACTVTDPGRATLVQRLVNRRGTVALPRVARAGHAVRRGKLERRLVLARRMTALGAREVEGDDARRL